MNPRDAKVCIRDSGLFVSIARAYGRQFNNPPYYSTPWEQQLGDGSALQIGDGYEELIRVRSMDEVEDECDLFIFLDIGDGAMQERLKKKGKRVFGAGKAGEDLELKRWHFYQTIKQLGMPVPKAERLIGISALRKHLMTHDNQWVKISQFRGIAETFHSESYLIIFPFLDWLEDELGARREVIEFVAYEPIDGEDVIEMGYDGFCIDGGFPKQAFWGYERKDKSYILTAREYDDLPEEVRYMNDMMRSTLKKIGYRGHYHTEGRKKGKDIFFTDITCRPGCPPGEIMSGMITNLPEIAWFGAEGKLVEPEVDFQYGVQAVIRSGFNCDRALTVSYPDEVADRVKLLNSCIVDGVEWVIPTSHSEEMGYVIGLSDDVEEAIDECRDVAKQFKAFEAKIDTDEIVNALKEVEKGEEKGLEFSDEPMPKAEEVL